MLKYKIPFWNQEDGSRHPRTTSVSNSRHLVGPVSQVIFGVVETSLAAALSVNFLTVCSLRLFACKLKMPVYPRVMQMQRGNKCVTCEHFTFSNLLGAVSLFPYLLLPPVHLISYLISLESLFHPEGLRDSLEPLVDLYFLVWCNETSYWINKEGTVFWLP